MKIFTVLVLFIFLHSESVSQSLLNALHSPILFQGDETTAYRDPAVLFYEQVFYLFFTVVEIEDDGKVFSYTATSQSSDLQNWTKPEKITPRDQSLNYSSPGNVIRFKDEWILCLQTYPRPDHYNTLPVRYGNQDARIFLMRSRDLIHWDKPEIMMVKGNEVPADQMGRMIDPYLLGDKDETGRYWCFYKQKGVSLSWSHDLKNWNFHSFTDAGENVCVLTENDEYILFHSPTNGIGILKSSNLKDWQPWGDLITLGQTNWVWARGRITAGTVVNLKHVSGIGHYLMFFHGSGPLKETEGDFDKNASIGIAWSKDLIHWHWPGN